MATDLLNLGQARLSGRIVPDHPVSDEEFEALCRSNELLQFERTAEGDIRMNPPTGDDTSAGNAQIIFQLGLWWRTHRRGRFYDSNGGFFLADGSVLSPDAAYLSAERRNSLGKGERGGIRHVCPDFVIELLSGSDSLAKTIRKMDAWMANGVTLAWLIDPYHRRVFVFEPGLKPVVHLETEIAGRGPVEGFTLNHEEIWACYED